MNLATLRVDGTDTALKDISDSLSLNIDASWKQGEAKRRGGNYNKSGFNACVADTETSKLLLEKIREFLLKCKNRKMSFSASDISAQLDIGIGVGSSEQFTASITFTPTELMYFTDIGLELCISVYPESDDED